MQADGDSAVLFFHTLEEGLHYGAVRASSSQWHKPAFLEIFLWIGRPSSLTRGTSNEAALPKKAFYGRLWSAHLRRFLATLGALQYRWSKEVSQAVTSRMRVDLPTVLGLGSTLRPG